MRLGSELVFAATGSYRAQALSPAHADGQRTWARVSNYLNHVRRGRLGHVARAGLVLNNLRIDFRRGVELERAVGRDSDDVVAVATCADGQGRAGASLS